MSVTTVVIGKKLDLKYDPGQDIFEVNITVDSDKSDKFEVSTGDAGEVLTRNKDIDIKVQTSQKFKHSKIKRIIRIKSNKVGNYTVTIDPVIP